MQENYAPIADVITMVANGQQGEATPLIHDLLGAKVAGVLQDYKQDIAQSLFAPSADTLAEDVEPLDEVSIKTASSVGAKRLAQGQRLAGAAARSPKDSLTAKVLGKQSEKYFDKSQKAVDYAYKKITKRPS